VASGALGAYGLAWNALGLSGFPTGWPSYKCSACCLRALVLGLDFTLDQIFLGRGALPPAMPSRKPPLGIIPIGIGPGLSRKVSPWACLRLPPFGITPH